MNKKNLFFFIFLLFSSYIKNTYQSVEKVEEKEVKEEKTNEVIKLKNDLEKKKKFFTNKYNELTLELEQKCQELENHNDKTYIDQLKVESENKDKELKIKYNHIEKIENENKDLNEIKIEYEKLKIPIKFLEGLTNDRERYDYLTKTFYQHPYRKYTPETMYRQLKNKSDAWDKKSKQKNQREHKQNESTIYEDHNPNPINLANDSNSQETIKKNKYEDYLLERYTKYTNNLKTFLDDAKRLKPENYLKLKEMENLAEKNIAFLKSTIETYTKKQEDEREGAIKENITEKNMGKAYIDLLKAELKFLEKKIKSYIESIEDLEKIKSIKLNTKLDAEDRLAEKINEERKNINKLVARTNQNYSFAITKILNFDNNNVLIKINNLVDIVTSQRTSAINFTLIMSIPIIIAHFFLFFAMKNFNWEQISKLNSKNFLTEILPFLHNNIQVLFEAFQKKNKSFISIYLSTLSAIVLLTYYYRNTQNNRDQSPVQYKNQEQLKKQMNNEDSYSHYLFEEDSYYLLEENNHDLKKYLKRAKGILKIIEYIEKKDILSFMLDGTIFSLVMHHVQLNQECKNKRNNLKSQEHPSLHLLTKPILSLSMYDLSKLNIIRNATILNINENIIKKMTIAKQNKKLPNT